MGTKPAPLRPLRWVASSRKDLKRFPEEVQDVMGRALLDVQFGDRPTNSKPMKGFSGGARTPKPEIDLIRDRYRTVEQHYRDQQEGSGP